MPRDTGCAEGRLPDTCNSHGGRRGRRPPPDRQSWNEPHRARRHPTRTRRRTQPALSPHPWAERTEVGPFCNAIARTTHPKTGALRLDLDGTDWTPAECAWPICRHSAAGRRRYEEPKKGQADRPRSCDLHQGLHARAPRPRMARRPRSRRKRASQRTHMARGPDQGGARLEAVERTAAKKTVRGAPGTAQSMMRRIVNELPPVRVLREILGLWQQVDIINANIDMLAGARGARGKRRAAWSAQEHGWRRPSGCLGNQRGR